MCVGGGRLTAPPLFRCLNMKSGEEKTEKNQETSGLTEPEVGYWLVTGDWEENEEVTKYNKNKSKLHETRFYQEKIKTWWRLKLSAFISV